MGPEADALRAYREKRRARSTPEPAGRAGGRRPGGTPRFPGFVVQQHDARTRHWDFRIEVDGVLRSWAVPKGPSTDPREKRLAVATEDHPLAYASFEGVIPEGAYGAGSVIVWDRGTYENRSRDEDGAPLPIADALARGHATLWLAGEKLRGGWDLVHARLRGDEASWLLTKRRDEGADARRRPTRSEPRSVLSGRTNAELRAAARARRSV